jgi:hypothetical protein
MDLARRFDRICHRASKHHLANRTQWATWVLLHGIAQSRKNVVLTSWEFFSQQITLMNPVTFPLWFGGLIWLLASREDRRYRVIAFPYLIALAEFIVMHGKNYYLAPAYPMLFAEGGVAFERSFALRFRWLKPAIAFLVVVSAVVLVPVVLPILSPEKLLAYMRAIHFEVPPTEHRISRRCPALCRSIRLGRIGELGRAGLRQLASGGAETRCHFLSELWRSGRDRFLWLEIRITASRSPAIKITFTGDRAITPAKS